MASYYNKHYGDLYPGHIAKASDINIIQQNTSDGISNAVKDLTEGQSWILGTNDQSDKDAFVLTPESKRGGRYVNQMVLAEGNDVDFVSIRETDYRQPIKLARSSIYSIIVRMQNKSERTVPVVFELQDEKGKLIPNMKTILSLPKETNTPTDFEIIFDLNYYPTGHGLNPKDLEEDDPSLVNQNTDEESSDMGQQYETEDLTSTTAGASIIYLHIEALNKSREKIDINSQNENGYQWNDEDPTFGLVINKNSKYGQLLEENNGSGYRLSSKRGDLHFKAIYANAPTYQCNFGQAIIGGEKVVLADTHVTIDGTITESSMREGNIYGNIMSYVYMDKKGHLKSINSEPFLGDEPIRPTPIIEDHLHIADIITYFNDTKDPLIIQDDESQITRPRSHHERIRRLEKKMSYLEDISIPPRFKCTYTENDLVDDNPYIDLSIPTYNGINAKTLDALSKDGYIITTDKNGNFIIKLSKNKTFSIPITLKTETAGKVSTEKNKTKVITTAQTSSYINKLNKDDITRAQTFEEIKNMKNDVTNGTLELATQETGITIATNKKEAKLTEFNPWDDSAANRPAKADVKPITRSYSVVNGRNSADDWVSEFPAMTFYTSSEYKLKKLQIPIYKFKNCSGIRFIIWERQGPNNKENTVWFERKIATSKVFSLKNAKIKGGYQYMEDGFLWDFGNDGLKLTKGQYVIVCFPIVDSGTGTVYVDTYKPSNPKDFCIRYYGAANGSHFLLKDRYQEIWYNSAKAQAEKINYSTVGRITSGTVTWTDVEPIKSIKPIINLSKPDKTTDVKIYVDIGGGWKEVEPNKDNNLSGAGLGNKFRWKIEFKGNSKETPIIKYDNKKKYAISFEITRSDPNTSNSNILNDLTKNLCITSKAFDANDILKNYLGDMNFNLDDNRFSNYEFARIWATDDNEDALLIDISASDQKKEITYEGKNILYSLYSLHYVDLKLSDIPQISVDYNNYDPYIEEDEHNLRLKLDTDNSYNDNDIRVVNYNSFKPTDNSYQTTNTNGLEIDLTKVTTSDVNQTIAKVNFDNSIDLSKYAALKLGFTLKGEVNGTLSGLGLYISSQNEIETPSNKDDDADILSALPDGLPDLNVSQQQTIDTYANQVVYREVVYNGTATKVYYKSIWNSEEGKWEWQMIHNIKSFNIYKIIDRSSKNETLTITKDNENEEQYIEIEIIPNNPNMQYAKEIGIILLNENQEYSRNNVNSIVIDHISAIKEDYYNAFSAKDGNAFSPIDERLSTVCKKSGKLEIPKTAGNTQYYTTTTPETSSIKITHQSVSANGEYLCSFDMTSKSTKGFNHIGLQLASDCILIKNMLELHLIQVDDKGIETVIETIKIPTINHVYYPTTSHESINLSQIFKKIKTTERFDKIGIFATPKFKPFAAKLKTSTTENNDTISLYIGNITLYKAKTIPIVYPVMRMKFYFDDMDDITLEKSGIRKIGTVLQYR